MNDVQLLIKVHVSGYKASMGTTKRKQREALQRRRSILAAAREVFWQKGYARATIAQIAETAELAPGTLYLYFTGKEALYVELLTEGYELLEQRLRAEAARQKDARAGAAGLIDVFFDFARGYPEYFDIIFFVLQRESARAWQDNFPAEQVERLDRWRLACQEAAVGILERVNFAPAQRRGAIVDAIWGMLAGVVFYFGKDDSFEAVATEAKTLLLTAVFGHNGEANVLQEQLDE